HQFFPIGNVLILVDNVAVGTADYQKFRPEVCTTYPGYPGCPAALVGFTYSLDTTQFANGQHTITALATDTNVPSDSASFAPVTVNMQNGNSVSINGTVTVSGVVQSGVTVNINGTQTRSAITGADGKYSVLVAVGGTYTVAPAMYGFVYTPNAVTLANVT